MKKWERLLAALLALVMLLALGAAQAETADAELAVDTADTASEPAAAEAEPAEAESADSEKADYTVDDFIGTWYPDKIYVPDSDSIVDIVEDLGWDPYDNTITIEPGKVTITIEGSGQGVFEGELAVHDGEYLLVMLDEENYYSGCILVLFEADGALVLSWQMSDKAFAYYTKEAPKGPGEVHKDKAIVKAAQQALNDAGYECGTPDGVAGKKTKAAITAYQTDNGLTVTGTVTDELLASLGLS